IKIERLRGIRECILEDFGRFNIFLGHNNCGKTTVLEAIYLFLGNDNIIANVNINNLRQLIVDNDEKYQLNFYDLDTSYPITLSGIYDDVSRSAEFKYWEQFAEAIDVNDIKDKQTALEKEYGLQLKFDISTETYQSRLILSSNEEKQARTEVPNDLGNHINSVYLSSIIGHSNFVNDFYSTVLKQKKEEKLIAILREIEPSIQDAVIANNLLMVDIGLKQRVPIQVLGDGIRKIFDIITAMFQCENGVLLIDEMENGFHFKTMPILWRAIIQTAKELNVQVFATTHNIDTLQAANAVLQEDIYTDMQTQWRAYTLRKFPDGELKSYKHTYEQFSYLLNKDREIR
ncbi:MAG: AAA family ATPase, partial [Prevotella sp.]|nr:AAA family ATPase [Prevotella sp.]